MKYFCFLYVSMFLGALPALSQLPNYNYVGVLKLNDSTFVPYKLAFEELEGRIQGYAISDMGGKHETKSNIKGTYNEERKMFSFREFDMVYTKAPITQLDMCLITFSGKMRSLENNKAFSGNFQSVYPDQSICLEGLLIMSNARNGEVPTAQVEEEIQKPKNIQKPKSIPQEVIPTEVIKPAFETLTMSVLKKDENLNIFTRSGALVVSLYDFGKVDDDRINLYLDGVLVLEDFSMTRDKKEVTFNIDKDITVVRVVATSEGASPPNTVKIEIKGNNQFITTSTSLHIGDQAELTFIRE